MNAITPNFEDFLNLDYGLSSAAPMPAPAPFGDRFDTGMRIVDALGIDLSLDTDTDILDLDDLVH